MEDWNPVKKIRPSAELLHRWLIVFIMLGFLLTALKDNLNSMHRGHLLFLSPQPTMYSVYPMVEETLWMKVMMMALMMVVVHIFQDLNLFKLCNISENHRWEIPCCLRLSNHINPLLKFKSRSLSFVLVSPCPIVQNTR